MNMLKEIATRVIVSVIFICIICIILFLVFKFLPIKKWFTEWIINILNMAFLG